MCFALRNHKNTPGERSTSGGWDLANFIDPLVPWFFDSMIQWFVGSLTHWIDEPWVHWFIDSLNHQARMIHCLNESSNHWLFDLLLSWLTSDSLVHWCFGSLTHWIVQSLTHCFTVSLRYCFIEPLRRWAIESLIHWFVDSLSRWFTVSLIHRCANSFIESLNHWLIDLLIHSVSCARILSFHWHLHHHLLIRGCTSQFQDFIVFASPKLSYRPLVSYTVVSSGFRNFRPGACRALSGKLM